MSIHCSHSSCDPPLPIVIKADWSLSRNEPAHVGISPTGRVTQTFHLRKHNDRNQKYIFILPKMKCISMIIQTNPHKLSADASPSQFNAQFLFQYGKISFSIPLVVAGLDLCCLSAATRLDVEADTHGLNTKIITDLPVILHIKQLLSFQVLHLHIWKCTAVVVVSHVCIMEKQLQRICIANPSISLMATRGGQRWRLLKVNSSIKDSCLLFIWNSHPTGVTAARLRQQLSNINVMFDRKLVFWGLCKKWNWQSWVNWHSYPEPWKIVQGQDELIWIKSLYSSK